MSYPQQPPGNWSDPSWPGQQQPQYGDPNQPASGAPASPAGYPSSGSGGYPPQQAYPAQQQYPDQQYPGQQPYPDQGCPQQAYPAQEYPAQAYAAQPYSGAPGGYPNYGYNTPQVVIAPQQQTNGLAIASMVVSIISVVGLFCYGLGGLLGVVGAILGHVARKQIKERQQAGDGMALAGVIVGWVALGLGLIIIALLGWFVWWAVENTPTYDPSPYAT